MRKKFWYGTIAVMVAVAFALMGTTASAKDWPKTLTLTTPPAGATLSVMGVGMAKIIEGTLKIPTSPENAKGSFPAAILMIKGDAQLSAISGCEQIYSSFDKKPYPKGSSKVDQKHHR